MKTLQFVIEEDVEDEEEFAELLHRVADMIEQGYKSGYHPYWTLIERE